MPKRELTGVVVSHQMPLLEYIYCEQSPEEGEWWLWLSYSKDKKAGTFLKLAADGSIMRMTLEPTGEYVNVSTIKRTQS